MDKTLRIVITIAVAVIAFSVFYVLVLRPIHRDNELGRCLERAEQIRANRIKVEYRNNCFKQY